MNPLDESHLQMTRRQLFGREGIGPWAYASLLTVGFLFLSIQATTAKTLALIDSQGPTEEFEGTVESVSNDGLSIVVSKIGGWTMYVAGDNGVEVSSGETFGEGEAHFLWGLNTGKPLHPRVIAFIQQKLQPRRETMAGGQSVTRVQVVRVVPRGLKTMKGFRADVFLPGEKVSINRQAVRLQQVLQRESPRRNRKPASRTKKVKRA